MAFRRERYGPLGDGLDGWTEDFDRALAMARTTRPVSQATLVAYKYVGLSRGVLLADDAALTEIDEALQVAERSSEGIATAAEICRRLDGMPLAIELAAARVRVLSLTEIRDGLHDRFRLLTGGARTAVRRQQTLRASVDWSHALLTETERILFGRLAVFMGGFDLDAAEAVAGGGDVERFQVLDLLTLLVDKSLVVAESTSGRTRYRLLETVRQYALEKLGESGQANTVRACHRDYYTTMAAMLDTPAPTGHEQRLGQAETEIDNLRAAFVWSRENSDIALASQLASSLQQLWLGRGRVLEGLAWFDAVLTDQNAHPAEVAPTVRAAVLADKATLNAFDGCHRQHGASPPSPGDRAGCRRRRPVAPGPDCLRWHRRLQPRGGPAILRRGDRPGPHDRRRVEAWPKSGVAGVRLGHGG